MIPYSGWHIYDCIVDGVSVGAVSSYTFDAVDRDHTITVFAKKNTTATVPATAENLKKLIDHLVNETPLDGNYDFDRDGHINGKDVILMQQMMTSRK